MAPAPPEAAEAAERAEKTTSSSSEARAKDPSGGEAAAARLQRLRLERVHKSVFGVSHEQVRAELSLAHVAFVGGDKPVRLQWGDVLGAHLLTASGERLASPVDVEAVATSQHYLLGVFACPTRTRKPGTVKKRHLMEWFFRFKGDQMQDALELLALVNFLADPRSLPAIDKAASVDDIVVEARAPRKYLVLINPVGGAGMLVFFVGS